MKFEYDVDKSHYNKHKHGIDFIEAQNLWNDEDLIKVSTLFEKEERYLYIGKLNDKYWTAVATHRNKSIRIISVRRSRKQEVSAYES